MTRRQYWLISKAHKNKITREQSYVGFLASQIANYSMSAPKEWVTAADYFPALEVDEQLTDEQATLKFNGAMTGNTRKT